MAKKVTETEKMASETEKTASETEKMRSKKKPPSRGMRATHAENDEELSLAERCRSIQAESRRI